MITTLRVLTPKVATQTMANSSTGNANAASVVRMRNESSRPPRYPATMAITTPMNPAITTTASDTSIATRLP
ncbi:MAG: hypothetical protein OEY70_13170 [Acidimicrobiia bacterium]|nr:hypothetical protein [Acidimicrobiia bacterium]